jgi:hypothetical protein
VLVACCLVLSYECIARRRFCGNVNHFAACVQPLGACLRVRVLCLCCLGIVGDLCCVHLYGLVLRCPVVASLRLVVPVVRAWYPSPCVTTPEPVSR